MQELCRLKPQNRHKWLQWTAVAKGSFLVFSVMTSSAQPPGSHVTELVPSNCQLVRNEEHQHSQAGSTWSLSAYFEAGHHYQSRPFFCLLLLWLASTAASKKLSPLWKGDRILPYFASDGNSAGTSWYNAIFNLDFFELLRGKFPQGHVAAWKAPKRPTLHMEKKFLEWGLAKWPLEERLVMCHLGTTEARCKHWPLGDGRENTPRIRKNSSNSLNWNLSETTEQSSAHNKVSFQISKCLLNC